MVSYGILLISGQNTPFFVVTTVVQTFNRGAPTVTHWNTLTRLHTFHACGACCEGCSQSSTSKIVLSLIPCVNYGRRGYSAFVPSHRWSGLCHSCRRFDGFRNREFSIRWGGLDSTCEGSGAIRGVLVCCCFGGCNERRHNRGRKIVSVPTAIAGGVIYWTAACVRCPHFHRADCAGTLWNASPSSSQMETASEICTFGLALRLEALSAVD